MLVLLFQKTINFQFFFPKRWKQKKFTQEITEKIGFMKKEFTLPANKIHKLRNVLDCADVQQFVM